MAQIKQDLAKLMVEFIFKVEDLRQQLELIDREIADHIRPLALLFDSFDPESKSAIV